MFVLLNLKAYRCDPVAVATAGADAASRAAVEFAVAGQTADLNAIAETGVDTWAQHVSANGFGSHTGSMLASRASANGASGTLLNHSERRLTLAAIQSAIEQAHEADLTTCVCANTPEQVAGVAAVGPEAVAIEPPELIGTGTPVSQADPDIVLDAIDAARTVDPTVSVFCGAGISSAADIEAAADLGADGVLLASAVATADDPEAALEALLEPFVN